MSYAQLNEITLNNILVEIGSWVFQRTLITSIVIPDSTTYIGEYAFYNCNSLSSITLSSNLKKLSSYMFGGCGFTEFEVPSNIETIESFCFYNNQKLNHVILPFNLTSLGGGVFNKCPLLTDIKFPENSAFRVSDNKFIVDSKFENLIQYFGSETEVTIPETISTIKSGAFQYNADVKIIECSSNLRTIEEKAFYQCTKLSKINLTSVENIGKQSFYSCNALTSLDFGENLKSIQSEAFYNCTSLQTITFYESISDSYSLEEYSFYNCTNLKSIQFSYGLQYIEQYSFSKCTSLSLISLPATLKYLGSHCFEESSINQVEFETDEDKNSSLTNLSSSCFKDCIHLSSINLPDSIQYIGFLCFSNTSIESFTVPKSTKTIDEQCFKYCESLTIFTIPKNCELTEIGNMPFSGCKKLSIIENQSPNFHILTGALYNQNMDKLIAFPPASSIKYFALSDQVRYISGGAFADCTNLNIITIPDNSVVQIDFSAFQGCINLQTINIPLSVTEIGDNAFDLCNKLRCGLNIDTNDSTTLMNWVNNAKLPMRSIQECKQITCEYSQSTAKVCTSIMLFVLSRK